jgi:hypothetical protein
LSKAPPCREYIPAKHLLKNLEGVDELEDELNPAASYKRRMEANITEWQAKITTFEQSPVYSPAYKDFAIAQMNRIIVNMEKKLIGFNKLIRPN